MPFVFIRWYNSLYFFSLLSLCFFPLMYKPWTLKLISLRSALVKDYLYQLTGKGIIKQTWISRTCDFCLLISQQYFLDQVAKSLNIVTGYFKGHLVSNLQPFGLLLPFLHGSSDHCNDKTPSWWQIPKPANRCLRHHQISNRFHCRHWGLANNGLLNLWALMTWQPLSQAVP